MRFSGFPAWFFFPFLFFLLYNLLRAPVLPFAVQASLVGGAQVGVWQGVKASPVLSEKLLPCFLEPSGQKEWKS